MTVETTDEIEEQEVPETTETEEQTDSPEEQNEDTFPRSYVEKLREENRRYRERAQDRDQLAEALFTARVAATGRLADPADLPFDAELLDDMPALEAAIEELLSKHPHYAARRPRGVVGQGASKDAASVDLAGLLRSRA